MRISQIVVDSNVLISAALSIQSGHVDSPSATLFSKVVQREIIAVASSQMLYELVDKLAKPKFGLRPEYIVDFGALLVDAVRIVAIRGLDMGCRDEKDNMFIETAVNGRVDALVTRDRDLQDAQTRYDLSKRNCQVLDVSQLLAILRNTGARLKT